MKAKAGQVKMSENRGSDNEQVRVEIQSFLLALDSYPDRFSADPDITFEEHRSSLVTTSKTSVAAAPSAGWPAV